MLLCLFQDHNLSAGFKNLPRKPQNFGDNWPLVSRYLNNFYENCRIKVKGRSQIGRRTVNTHFCFCLTIILNFSPLLLINLMTDGIPSKYPLGTFSILLTIHAPVGPLPVSKIRGGTFLKNGHHLTRKVFNAHGKQNRGTERCSKLKRSVDMTSSGRIVSTLEQMGQDQVSGRINVLCPPPRNSEMTPFNLLKIPWGVPNPNPKVVFGYPPTDHLEIFESLLSDKSMSRPYSESGFRVRYIFLRFIKYSWAGAENAQGPGCYYYFFKAPQFWYFSPWLWPIF